MRRLREKVMTVLEWIEEGRYSAYRVAEETGVRRDALKKYIDGDNNIDNMSLVKAEHMEIFYEQEMDLMRNSSWEFVDYSVEDTSKGNYEFTFRDTNDDEIGVVVVDEENDYKDMIRALNDGADPIVEGWEDGGGNTLNINGWGGSPAE